MQRIVILGNAGSGKSTLARQIGARLGVPVVHLDTLFWETGWVEPDAETFRTRVRNAVAGEAWVCEGNYARRTFDLRLPRADLVIWLDTPRLTCLKRVILRRLRMGIADATLAVDGRCIYTATDLKVGLFTSTDSF